MKAKEPLPSLDCACATVRRTARLITQLYSNHMGSAIDPAQFSLLTMLNRRPNLTQAPLARALGLDKTTISRNLRLVEKNGWVELSPKDDRRERAYRLTARGKEILSATEPRWADAQAKLRAALTSEDWETVLRIFDRVSESALASQNTKAT